MATTYLRRPLSTDLSPSTARRAARSSRGLSIALWTLQSLLAVTFVMTGAMKLLSPADMLAAQTPLPILLVRFIGTCEIAGALGLLLPGLLRVKPSLTPLAAACLVVLMICATILTPIMIAPDPVVMLLPATVGALAAFVAYARLRLVPLRARS